jgi:hypothetical protein
VFLAATLLIVNRQFGLYDPLEAAERILPAGNFGTGIVLLLPASAPLYYER